MKQEYYKIQEEISLEKMLNLKVKFTSQIVDNLLKNFNYKISNILDKIPHQNLDSKAIYLRLLKDNWVDLIQPDQKLVLEILVQNANKLDYSEIHKYIPIRNDRQLNNQKFELKRNNEDLKVLTEYIYSAFKLALEESFIEFYTTLDTIKNVKIDDVKIIFDDILHRIAIEKFGILNTTLEIIPKINIWQRAFIAFRNLRGM